MKVVQRLKMGRGDALPVAFAQHLREKVNGRVGTFHFLIEALLQSVEVRESALDSAVVLSADEQDSRIPDWRRVRKRYDCLEPIFTVTSGLALDKRILEVFQPPKEVGFAQEGLVVRNCHYSASELLQFMRRQNQG